jgi:hypothetical protein
MATILVTPIEDGAAVQFPKDRELIDRLKARFPKARWSVTTRSWHIPGKFAAKRAEKWAVDEQAYLRQLLQAERDAEFDNVELARALASRRAEIKSRNVLISGRVITYPFPYNVESIAIARSLPNAYWDRDAKAWTFKAAAAADIDVIIDGCNRILSLNLAAQKQHEAKKAAQRAECAKDREGRRTAAQAERDADNVGSLVWLAATAPSEGNLFRHRGSPVVCRRVSRAFRVDLDAFSVEGGMPSLDEEWCVRVWLREATADEAATLETREAAAKRLAEARTLISNTCRRACHSGEQPDAGGHEPAGETIWANTKLSAYGQATKLIVAKDGVWLIEYHGGDGDAWGSYNCGYNTHGYRLQLTSEEIAALRAAAALTAGCERT